MNATEVVTGILPVELRGVVSDALLQSAEELRIRVNRPVQIIYPDSDRLIEVDVTPSQCQQLLVNICGRSLYACANELRSCYVTLESGHRAGIAGRAYSEGGRLVRITHATGFNIRIARQIRGCADAVMKDITEAGRPLSTLVISPPGAGKTTLLRDIARALSDDMKLCVCMIDERSELAGSRFGIPSLYVGKRTDVLDGCSKTEALRLMVRAMSPDVIVTDEVGGKGDASAVSDAARCGVAVMASAHAGSLEEAAKRQEIKHMLKCGCFQRVIEISRAGGVCYSVRTAV